MRAEDTVIDGKHEGIISPDVFDAAQLIMQGRSFLPARSHQSRHLLSGLIRCGDCGRSLSASHEVSRIENLEKAKKF